MILFEGDVFEERGTLILKIIMKDIIIKVLIDYR